VCGRCTAARLRRPRRVHRWLAGEFHGLMRHADVFLGTIGFRSIRRAGASAACRSWRGGRFMCGAQPAMPGWDAGSRRIPTLGHVALAVHLIRARLRTRRGPGQRDQQAVPSTIPP
jgi:hypothetical protein